MTGQLKAVRFVRCPRCRGLLQESPNVPVYECGGCGAVLKAKNRKNDTKDTGSHVRATETAQKNKLEHVSDSKESGSLCQEEALASKGELPSDKNCVFDQNEIQDSKREQSEDTKFSRVLSTGLASHGNENLPAVRAEMEVDRGQCSLEQNNGRRQNEYGFCNKKQTDGLSFSDEVTCSTEPSQHENEEPSLVDGAYSELAKKQDNGRNKNEYGYCNSKQPGGVCFSNELISSTEPNHHPTEVSSPVAGTSSELDLEENNGKNQNRYGFYKGEQPQGVSFSDEVASSTELDQHGSGESSPVDGAYGEIRLEQNNGMNRNHDGYCNGKEPPDASFSSELASSTELHHNESGESSPMDEAYGEISLEQNNGRNRNHDGNCNGKESLDASFSSEPASSTELHHNESGESSPMDGAYGDISLEQNNGRNQNHDGYCKGKEPLDASFSSELASSTELHHNESGESSPMDGAYGEINVEQNNGRNQNHDGYCKGKEPLDASFSSEPASSTELHHNESGESSPMDGASGEISLEQNNGRNRNHDGNCNGKEPLDASFSSEPASSTELHHNESGESSPIDGANGEISLEQNNGSNRNHDGNCNGNEPLDASFSSEPASSTKLHHNESGESSPMDGASGEISLEQNNGRNRNHDGNCNGKEPLDASFSSEPASSTELHHNESGESLPMDGTYGEISLEQNNGRNQNHDGYCNGKEPLDASFSSELISSSELNHQENKESSPVAGTYNVVDLEQNNGWDNEHGYCNWKQPRGVSFSDELASSSELNHHEIKEPSLEAVAYNEMDLEQSNGRNQNEYGCNNGKQPGSVNFSNVIASSTELNHGENEDLSQLAGVHREVDENKDCLEQSSGRNQNEFGDFQTELPGFTKISNEVSSCTGLTCQEIEELSTEVGTNTELDDNFNSRFVFRSLNVENLLSASPRDEIITAHMPLGEKVLADQMSPHSEELEQSQKRALNSFDPAGSTDTLENVAFAEPSSGFRVILKDMPKSPTTRSYYACDSNVSSYDGTYDQVPNCTRAMPRRDEAMYNITSNYPETQHQAWNCSSEKKHCSRKGSKWGQDELSESRKQRHPGRSRMKFETDDRLSRMPYYSRGRQVGYENGRSSRYGQSEFQCSTSSRPPGKCKYLELEEKMELLKMVNELKDRLNRTNISEGKGNGRFPGVSGVEKQIPSYYDRAAQQVECHDLRNTRYSGRCNQGRRWPRRSRISQIPFSANATISKHQVDRSCLPCCPQDWQYSAPLPPHICCNKSQHTVQKRTYNLDHCGPSSSKHYTGSEFSLEGTIHHDEEKKYSRDKRQLAKRHVRPVAGGAPFVVCYGCSELLLLPVDFLLFKRRCHELRCSACSVILKFSLQNGTQIVPYTDTIAPPPPSELDGRRDANNGGKLASVFHAEPMSCSDDYGPPVCKSGSTEGDAFSVPLPFHTLKRSSSGRRVSASSSLEPMEARRMQPISRDSQNFASRAGPSSNLSKAEKISSEIEELPPTACPALHTLMGYSSPSELITNGC